MEKWKKFSLIEKLQLRTNKYHNSSVKLWILRKYAIELISKESYKKDTKRYHKSFTKASQGVFTIAYPS